jgi:hypothetical protein
MEMVMADEDEGGGLNGYDQALLKAAIYDMEGYDREMESAKARYMSEAKAIREKKKARLESARDNAGIPTAELKVILKTREYERKVKKLEDGLDDDGAARLEGLYAALGEDFRETPLGVAAVEREKAAADIPRPGKRPPSVNKDGSPRRGPGRPKKADGPASAPAGSSVAGITIPPTV